MEQPPIRRPAWPPPTDERIVACPECGQPLMPHAYCLACNHDGSPDTATLKDRVVEAACRYVEHRGAAGFHSLESAVDALRRFRETG